MAKEEERTPPKTTRRSTFFYVRVSILLFILFVVVLYAVADYRSRRERRSWERTLDVAVVLVHVAGTEPASAEACNTFVARAPALTERLAAEARRHRPSMSSPPFRVVVFGPVEAAEHAPTPSGDGPVDLAKQAIALRRWREGIEESANVVPSHWDTRIFVTVRRPASSEVSFVEGQSQQGGRVGTVDVELDEGMADLALAVVAHELFHTLGATDRYDASGRTIIPDGLVEPRKVPLYPQRFADVMGRNRPSSPTNEEVPAGLDEIAVGDLTAREIGWREP